jgi:CubicO group peptidase (beta-lactamase class C family)
MCDEHLAAAVDALLDEVVGSGTEVGLQVAVIRRGPTRVDTARGVSDPRTGAAVDRDSLFWAGSTAKGVASSVAHVLIERGDVTDDMRVVMRNRFSAGDFTTVERIDRLVEDELL